MLIRLALRDGLLDTAELLLSDVERFLKFMLTLILTKRYRFSLVLEGCFLGNGDLTLQLSIFSLQCSHLLERCLLVTVFLFVALAALQIGQLVLVAVYTVPIAFLDSEGRKLLIAQLTPVFRDGSCLLGLAT